jgi:hypothetical protein
MQALCRPAFRGCCSTRLRVLRGGAWTFARIPQHVSLVMKAGVVSKNEATAQ